MKVVVILACLAASVMTAPPVAKTQPQLTLSMIDLAAISRMTPGELELLAEGLAAEEMIRKKRSNQNQIQSKLGSSISSKVGLLGQASAGIASFVSSASAGSSGSKGEEHGYSYGPPAEEESSKFDFFGLKKSILNTLFQAVKAITGGVTILKGQLIKGGGALAAAAGKVISVKGEAVTNIGKKIVNSASLSPPKKHHAKPVYGPPPAPIYTAPAHEYHGPTAPGHYGIHSAPSAPGYSKYTAQYEGRGKPLSGLHAGLILLKPLEGELDGHSSQTINGQSHLEPPANLLSTAYQSLKSVINKANPFATFAKASAEVHYPEHENYGAPPTAFASYGPPPSAAASYGLPTASAASYGPPQSAHEMFGPPSTAPAAYGQPPSQTDVASFGSSHNEPHTSPALYNSGDTLSSLELPPPPPPPNIPPTSHDLTATLNHQAHQAFNSYGLPAAQDSYSSFSYNHDSFTSRNAILPFDVHTDFGTKKYSPIAESVRSRLSKPKFKRHHKRLTPEKLSKINAKLNKINANLQSLPRSSQELPVFDGTELNRLITKKMSQSIQNTSDIDRLQSLDKSTPAAIIDLNAVSDKDSTVIVNETEPTPIKEKEDAIKTSDQTPAVTEIKPVRYVLKGNKIVPVFTTN